MFQKIDKKFNKFLYLYVVQGNFAIGWEDVYTSENKQESIDVYHDYNRNDRYHCYRWVYRRELNPDYHL